MNPLAQLTALPLALVMYASPLAAEACAAQKDPWLALALAMQKDQIELLDCLVTPQMLNGFDPADINEQTPLHKAANFNRPRVIYYLLQRGARVDSKNFLDKTPLLVAIEAGAEDAAAVLIFNGADISLANTQGKTPLYWSVVQGNVTLTNLLLQRGANPDQTVTIYSSGGDQHTTIKALGKKSKHSAIRTLFIK